MLDISKVADHQKHLGSAVGFGTVIVLYCYYCFNAESQAPPASDAGCLG